MFCSSCGAAAEKNAAYCPECGKAMNHETPIHETPTYDEKGVMPPHPSLSPPPPYVQQMHQPYVKPPGSFDLRRFLTFEMMITPLIIKILYVAGSIIIVLIALFAMFGGISNSNFGLFFTGIFGGTIGLVAYRVYLEVMILLFKIYQELKAINKNAK